MHHIGNHQEIMGDEKVFTIITVVLNGVSYLKECFDGMRNQSIKNFQYIVIDGGSTDGSIELAQENFDIIDVYLSEADLGIYHAMNKGLALSKGKVIGIINSDDRYKLDALESVLNYTKFNFGKKILYGGLIDEKNPNKVLFIEHELLPKKMIYHPSVFVSRDVYETLGVFNTKYKVAGDYEFMLRCYKSGVDFIGIDRALAVYRQGGYSHSHKLTSIFETTFIQLQYFPTQFIFIMFNCLKSIAKVLFDFLLNAIFKKKRKKND